jgi:hypothetical protein
MNEPNDFHLTSGDGSILIEIVSECVPITPEIEARPRTLSPYLKYKQETESPHPNENPPPEQPE